MSAVWVQLSPRAPPLYSLNSSTVVAPVSGASTVKKLVTEPSTRFPPPFLQHVVAAVAVAENIVVHTAAPTVVAAAAAGIAAADLAVVVSITAGI